MAETSNHMEADSRRMRIPLWDLGPVEPDDAEETSAEHKAYLREREAFRGPLQIEMWSVDARDALTRQPTRYAVKLPKGVKPGPAHEENLERIRAEQADFAAVRAKDPIFGGVLQP